MPVDPRHNEPVLPRLGLNPESVGRLGANERSRLLGFLLCWEYFEELHASLDVLMEARPKLLSLQDLRVRACLAEGRPDDALAVMKRRLDQRASVTAQVLLARVQLARGSVIEASRIASDLVQAEPYCARAWALAVDVALARGDLPSARAACRKLAGLKPGSRNYLRCMVSVHRAAEDWVTATSYAVALLTSDAEVPVSTTDLRMLHEYFQASGDLTRVADIEAELASRYTLELAELLGERVEEAVDPAHAPTPEPGAAAATHAAAICGLEAVDVTDAEADRICQAVRDRFGFEALLPGQREVLACVLRGEDVLAILPTGGGKSLCYQLPALMAESGVTLVVSPLIALMKDQVDSLPGRAGDLVTAINSGLDGDELRHRMQEVQRGHYRLVYAAPERLRQPPFLAALKLAGVNRLVIGEAHCVSVWGHDFRPDYLAIGRARAVLGDPPLLCVTATAPERVRRDILATMGEMRVIVGDVMRPNLRLEVARTGNLDDKYQRLLALCCQESGSGIVYVDTRDRAEELAALLRGQGLSAVHYHAGIEDRSAVQDQFMSGRARIVVATVAFGLGIDKPDIRFIIHFAPPPSLENYYQEAGRAGRDGLPARCVLMYSPSDRATLTRRAKRDLLSQVYLRSVHAAVEAYLQGKRTGRVAMSSLQRELREVDELKVRVALSFLERAGLLRRDFDVPRGARVRVDMLTIPESEPELLAFCRAARLRRGQMVGLDLVETAREAGFDPVDLELQLVRWAAEGLLTYRPAGRDMLLELPAASTQAWDRLAELLEQHRVIQAQRVSDIAAYAETRRCRHGYVGQYLGGRVVSTCGACDNCAASEVVDAALPSEAEQLLVVLRCVADGPWGWGRVNLVLILRGDPEAPERGRAQIGFGALAYRSRAAVEGMLTHLEEGGYLRSRRLNRGGEVLELTKAGDDAIGDPTVLQELTQRPASRSSPEPSPEPTRPPEEALLQRLRAWRLEAARAQRVAPFIVFADEVLRRIAARRPTSLAELAEVKGIGPRKLAQYGEVIIELCAAFAREAREAD